MKDITPAGLPKAAGTGDLEDARLESSGRRKMRPHDNRSAKALALRLDRAFAEMNAFLLAFAIGLAALDATYFVGTRYADLLHDELLSTQAAPAAAPSMADTFMASAR
jgi:hypothetical protein